MLMLMAIVTSEARERVEAVLAEHRVSGYTEIPAVHGTGRTGLRLGSRAFPETSSILFTVVERAKADELIDALRAAAGDSEGSIRLILWGVERML
jgi:hypothetical protein